jgi:hypothetical protein
MTNMNVYQQQYESDFIKSLPVNFNKIKNMDLSVIPKQYHGLFTTDWNWGKYSKMPMTERMNYHEINQEYHRTDVQSKLFNKQIKPTEVILGFPKD